MECIDSDHKKRRYLLANTCKYVFHEHKNLEAVIKEVNKEANTIIQKLNLSIPERNIPYVKLEVFFRHNINKMSNVKNERVRFTFASLDDDEIYDGDDEKITKDCLSHFLYFLYGNENGERKLTINQPNYDGKLVMSQANIISAMVDVLIDISMCNSYSFLRKRPIAERQSMSTQKFRFYQRHETDMPCYYEVENEGQDLYYSFAFSARHDDSAVDGFDIDKYIKCWNGFINEEYSDKVHNNKTILKQLEEHKDYGIYGHGQLSQLKILRIFDTIDAGSYLLLRTNKSDSSVSENVRKFVSTEFGFSVNPITVGHIKVVPLSDYERIKPMLDNLDVTAFKIIKSTAN